MNLKELEAFDAVLKAGTITEAARYIHRTQSQTTRLIAGLEDRIGFKLFDRSRRRLALTPRGREFHERVVGVLEKTADLDAYARRVRLERQTHLRVLCAHHLAVGLLPQPIGNFMKSNPKCTVSVETKSRAELTEQLLKPGYDIGLLTLPVDAPNASISVFKRNAALAVVPAAHPFSSRKKIQISELVGTPIITTKPGTILRMHIDAEFKRIGEVPNIIVEHSHSICAGLLVSNDVGIAILDHYMARQISIYNVKIIPIFPEVFLEYAFVTPSHEETSFVVEDFKRAVMESC